MTIAFTTYDASWSAVVQRYGAVQRNYAVVKVHLVNVHTGRVSDVDNVEMATDLNIPQWLPSGDALLLNVVERT